MSLLYSDQELRDLIEGFKKDYYSYVEDQFNEYKLIEDIKAEIEREIKSSDFMIKKFKDLGDKDLVKYFEGIKTGYEFSLQIFENKISEDLLNE